MILHQVYLLQGGSNNTIPWGVKEKSPVQQQSQRGHAGHQLRFHALCCRMIWRTAIAFVLACTFQSDQKFAAFDVLTLSFLWINNLPLNHMVSSLCQEGTGSVATPTCGFNYGLWRGESARQKQTYGSRIPTPGVSPSSAGMREPQGNKAWPDTKCMFAIQNYHRFLNVFHLARTMSHRLDTLSRSNSSGDDWYSVYALYLSNSFAVMISGLPRDLLRRRAELSTHQIKPAPVVPPSLYMAWSFSFQHPLPLEFTARLQPLLYFLTLLLFQPPWFSRLFSCSLYAQILLSVWVFLNISWKPNPAGLCLIGPALRSSLVFVSIPCCISRFDFLCWVKSETAILLKFGWMQTRSIDLLDVSSLICTGAFEMKESIKWKKHCYLETIFKCCASEAY